MEKRFFGLVCLMLAGSTCFGQRVQWQGFKLTEENDFLNLTQRGLDRYYTQGLRFDFVYTTSQRKFFEKILIPVSDAAHNQYTIGVSQQIYTPRIINKHPSEFTRVDMPYGGNLYVTYKLDSYNSIKGVRYSSGLSLGMIGPVSMGERTQGLFHKIIQNNPAVGWDTQLRNDLLLNYSFSIDKQIIQQGLFSLETKAEVKAGTLLVSGLTGLNLRLGNWQKPSKFAWEIFFLPEVRAVAYNAMLQGGIINRLNGDEPYSQFLLDEKKPVVYAHSTGFQIRYKRCELLYRQVNVTREFSGQLPHYYGSATLTFWFREYASLR